jgi:hypothetical protein
MLYALRSMNTYSRGRGRGMVPGIRVDLSYPYEFWPAELARAWKYSRQGRGAWKKCVGAVRKEVCALRHFFNSIYIYICQVLLYLQGLAGCGSCSVGASAMSEDVWRTGGECRYVRDWNTGAVWAVASV